MNYNCVTCGVEISEKIVEFCKKNNKPIECMNCQKKEKKTDKPKTVYDVREDLIIRQTVVKSICTLPSGLIEKPEDAIVWAEIFYNWIRK